MSTGELQSLVYRWGPALLMMALIFWLSSLPSNVLPSFTGLWDLLAKKSGHVLVYALLGRAYLRGIGHRQPAARLMAWILAVAFAASDEFHQSFVPGRGATAVDVGIDAVGAALGIWLR